MENMINTIFLFSGLFPLALGLGYFFKPSKILKMQTWFRKRLEKFEKRLCKRHRKVGVCFTLIGLFVIYTYFQPVWIYDMFVIARYVMGVIFPQAFEQVRQVSATPMVCI